jgi:hypothetical protein
VFCRRCLRFTGLNSLFLSQKTGKTSKKGGGKTTSP